MLCVVPCRDKTRFIVEITSLERGENREIEIWLIDTQTGKASESSERFSSKVPRCC